MAKEAQVQVQVQEETTELVTNQSGNLRAAFEIAKGIPIADQVMETGAYIKFEEGVTVQLCLHGITTFTSTMPTNEGEEVEAADLEDNQGNRLINADSVMVSTAKKLVAKGLVPCILTIFSKGEKKGANGRYSDLQIYRVPVVR